MEFEKVYEDFEKRYEKKCDFAFFAGMPIIFFKSPELELGCALSIGGYAAARRRADERVVVQFSDSTDFVTVNLSEREKSRRGTVCGAFYEAYEKGILNNGAEILFRYNTSLYRPDNAMMIKLAEEISGEKTVDLCSDVALGFYSRQNHVTAFDGGKPFYYPFPDNLVKIIISDWGERKQPADLCLSEFCEKGVSALEKGDYEKLGVILNEQTKEVLSGDKSAFCEAFEITKIYGDAYGSGVCRDGKLYSVVPNSSVDMFIFNFSREFKNRIGGKPRFYITRAEDCGILYLPD